MFVNVPPNFYAQNIQTGNANAQSTVQTDIQGSGSVSTHIEVSANGEKKVLDSNSPGTYKLEVNSSSNNTNGNRTIAPTASLSPASNAASATPKIITIKNETHNSSFLLNLKNSIQNFLNELLSAFKFN